MVALARLAERRGKAGLKTSVRLGLALGIMLQAICSFRGGDFAPIPTEPETPCLKEANEICKDKLKATDMGNCVAREKYRCELEEQQPKDAPTPSSS